MVLSFIEIDDLGLVNSFMDATCDGDVSKVVDMVEAGMPVDIVDDIDCTALRWAASSNRTDVVRFLLERGANVNKQVDDGQTALHVASNNNCTDAIRILLEYGAMNIKEVLGNTPIDLAQKKNNEEAVRLLQQY